MRKTKERIINVNGTKKIKEKGITLIALVITILVLIILAGVTLSVLTGENGIINRAQQAKENTETKSAEEQLKIAVMSSMDFANGSSEILIDELNKNIQEIKGIEENTVISQLPTNIIINGINYRIEENGDIQSNVEEEVRNLFDKDNPQFIKGYISITNDESIVDSDITDTFYIKCKPNTTYILSRTSYNVSDQVWRMATVSTEPRTGISVDSMVGGLINDLTLTITTPDNAEYLLFSEGRTTHNDDLSKFFLKEE